MSPESRSSALPSYRHASVALLLLCGAIGTAWGGSLFQGWGGQGGGDTFLEPHEVFVPATPERDGAGWRIDARIADGYYVYRHALKVLDREGDAVALALPAGTPRHDEFFGDTVIYQPPGLALGIPADAQGPLQLHWQGCAEAGICYPPQTVTVALPELDAPAPAPALPPSTTPQAGDGAGGGGAMLDTAVAALAESSARSPSQSTDAGDAGDARVARDHAASTPSPALSIADADGSPEAQRLATSPQSTSPSQLAMQPHTGLAEDQAAAARLASAGPILGALLFFGFGLLLAFTPCTLPMIPIVSSLVVGGGAGPRRALALSTVYVLAMATTYAAVGVVAGMAGANLQAALQSPWLLGPLAVLFLVLAASLFGAFELRLPAALANRLELASRRRQGGSVTGAAALGLLSALLVGPCMTAPLAGALLYIGQTGSAVVGGLALFALGLGMGLPLVLIATFGARVLPKPGPWMERVRQVFGFVMVGMAITMLVRFVPGQVALVLWGLWGLGIALGLFSWARSRSACHGGHTLRLGALFAGLWSVMMLVGAAAGGDSPLRPLEVLGGQASATAAVPKPDYIAAKSVEDVDGLIAEAGRQGRWTLVDVYADWCVSCHVIEREVFGDAAVAERLAGMQVLRPDVTGYDTTDQALLKRWQVMGPPALILIGPDGQERRAQRSVGEVDARTFAARLDAAGVP